MGCDSTQNPGLTVSTHEPPNQRSPMDTPQNPYADPTAGRTGLVHEILESLTNDQLKEYVDHLLWRQANGTFPARPENPYASRGYFVYRTNNWIIQCREILRSRGVDPYAR